MGKTSEQIQIKEKLESSVADDLIELIDRYFEKQRDLIRLVTFLDARQHELDDYQALVLRNLEIQYPEYPSEGLATLVDMFGNLKIDDAQDAHEQISEILEVVDPQHLDNEFMIDLARAHFQAPSAPRLFEALLIVLVSDIEVFIGQLCRLLGKVDPAPLMGEDATFSWREVSQHKSIEEFRDTVVEQRVNKVLRGSAKEWISHLERKHKLKLSNSVQDKCFYEIFERRHLVVHAEGRASASYLDEYGEYSDITEVGERLFVDQEYLKDSADLLFGAAYSLVASAGAKVTDPERYSRVESQLVDVPYRLLQESRLSLVSRICKEYKDTKFRKDEHKLIMSVNYWLSLKLVGRFDECKSEVGAWQVSMLNPKYRFAKHALLDEFDEALDIGKTLRGTEDFPMRHWLTWPLAANVREYERNLQQMGLEP